MGVLDWKHWIVLLAVVILVFGTKKLKSFGGDLGESIKGFRKAMSDGEYKSAEPDSPSAQPVTSVSNSVQHSQVTTNDGQAELANEPKRKY